MNAAVVILLLVFATVGGYQQTVYTFDDFVAVNGDSLNMRYDNAVAQGRQGNTDSFWVAYEMSVRAGGRSNSVDGIDVVQKNTPDRIGMFILVRKSDGAINKLRIVDLSGDVRVHDRKVYWLRQPNTDDPTHDLSD